MADAQACRVVVIVVIIGNSGLRCIDRGRLLVLQVLAPPGLGPARERGA